MAKHRPEEIRRELLRTVFFNPHSPVTEVAKKFGVTRERIRQLQNIALSKLRRARENKHSEMHIYEVRPRKDKCGVDLISDALPFGRLWYGEPDATSNAIGYAKFYSRSHHAVIRV